MSGMSSRPEQDDSAHLADAMDEQVVAARLRALPSRLLGLAAVRSERLVGDGLAEADARKWHYAVLVTLREFGPASQAELSRRTGIYRSDLVAVINELAAGGHVERAPDAVDRRRNVITLTPQGRGHLGRLDSRVDSAQEVLLAPLTGPEREELTRLLTLLVDPRARPVL